MDKYGQWAKQIMRILPAAGLTGIFVEHWFLEWSPISQEKETLWCIQQNKGCTAIGIIIMTCLRLFVKGYVFPIL